MLSSKSVVIPFSFNRLRAAWYFINMQKSKVLPSQWTSLLSRHKSNRWSRTTEGTEPAPIGCCLTHWDLLWHSKFFSCKSHVQRDHKSQVMSQAYCHIGILDLVFILTPKTLSLVMLHFQLQSGSNQCFDQTPHRSLLIKAKRMF